MRLVATAGSLWVPGLDVWQEAPRPSTIPAVEQLLHEGLDLEAGVTVLVGENGSGVSTLVEAIAMAFGLASEGGTRNVQEGTGIRRAPAECLGVA